GVQNIKPTLLTSARSMGASRWQIFRWVIFPHMIPSFFAGLRLGMTGVLLGVLLAELYVSTAGIGHFTTLFTQSFNPTKLLGLISMLAAMAILLNEIVGAYCIARDQGHPISAIPVFLHRRFRHGFVFINTAAGIKSARDLIGKRVGGTNFMPAGNIWMRGILEEHYGVPHKEIIWIV